MMGLFEFLYYLGYRAKTAHNLKRRRRLPARVISIGNITTGGTGKTPAAVALALEARRRGFRPCVLTRGYRGSLKGPVVIEPGMRAGEAGDEPLLMAGKLGGIPVVKCAGRYEAGMFALSEIEPPPDLFILDDGFQHRRLYRDRDVLLINGRDPFDNGKLLPMGLLREPLDAMGRADVVLITKARDVNTRPLLETIRRYNSKAPVFSAGFRLSSVIDASGERRPVNWLKGRDVYAFCGIGEPGSFRESISGTGAILKGMKAFRDHHRFTQEDIRKISTEAHVKGAPWIITTEKDIMRLRDIEVPENLLALEIEFVAGEGYYDEVFK